MTKVVNTTEKANEHRMFSVIFVLLIILALVFFLIPSLFLGDPLSDKEVTACKNFGGLETYAFEAANEDGLLSAYCKDGSVRWQKITRE